MPKYSNEEARLRPLASDELPARSNNQIYGLDPQETQNVQDLVGSHSFTSPQLRESLSLSSPGSDCPISLDTNAEMDKFLHAKLPDAGILQSGQCDDLGNYMKPRRARLNKLNIHHSLELLASRRFDCGRSFKVEVIYDVRYALQYYRFLKKAQRNKTLKPSDFSYNGLKDKSLPKRPIQFERTFHNCNDKGCIKPVCMALRYKAALRTLKPYFALIGRGVFSTLTVKNFVPTAAHKAAFRKHVKSYIDALGKDCLNPQSCIYVLPDGRVINHSYPRSLEAVIVYEFKPGADGLCHAHAHIYSNLNYHHTIITEKWSDIVGEHSSTDISYNSSPAFVKDYFAKRISWAALTYSVPPELARKIASRQRPLLIDEFISGITDITPIDDVYYIKVIYGCRLLWTRGIDRHLVNLILKTNTDNELLVDGVKIKRLLVTRSDVEQNGSVPPNYLDDSYCLALLEQEIIKKFSCVNLAHFFKLEASAYMDSTLPDDDCIDVNLLVKYLPTLVPPPAPIIRSPFHTLQPPGCSL